MAIVLDASTAAAAVLPDENPSFARAAVAAALREGLVVPVLWAYEVQNALATAQRRSRIGSDALDRALRILRALEPQLEPPQGLGQELRLAQAYGLSAYDASYVAVALSVRGKLATNDRKLRDAASRAGVLLFEPKTVAKRPRK